MGQQQSYIGGGQFSRGPSTSLGRNRPEQSLLGVLDRSRGDPLLPWRVAAQVVHTQGPALGATRQGGTSC